MIVSADFGPKSNSFEGQMCSYRESHDTISFESNIDKSLCQALIVEKIRLEIDVCGGSQTIISSSHPFNRHSIGLQAEGLLNCGCPFSSLRKKSAISQTPSHQLPHGHDAGPHQVITTMGGPSGLHFVVHEPCLRRKRIRPWKWK